MKRIIPIIALIWLAGCKPFTPETEPTGQTPVFTSSGMVDGQMQTFLADGENYIAFAERETDSLGVLIHKAGLRVTNCVNCEDRISVELRSISQTDYDVVSILNQNKIAIRFFGGLDSILNYHIQLNPEYIGNPTQVSWSVAGQNFNGNAPDFSIIAGDFGTKIPINFIIDFAGGCQVSRTDTVFLPSHLCDAQITSAMIDSLTYEYTVQGQFGNGYKYHWLFNNGQTASSKNVKIYYPTPIIDKEIALLTLANEHNLVTKRFARPLTANASCDMNLNYQIDEVFSYFTANPKADYGQMVLRYELNGEIFSSELIEQPSEASFIVESFEEYTDPTISDRTFVKVNMVFNGLVSNGTQTIKIQDLKLVLPYEI